MPESVVFVVPAKRWVVADDVEAEPITTGVAHALVGPHEQPRTQTGSGLRAADREAVHVASVHRYDAAQKTMLTVPGSGGLSDAPNTLEGVYALSWAKGIWSEMLG